MYRNPRVRHRPHVRPPKGEPDAHTVYLQARKTGVLPQSTGAPVLTDKQLALLAERIGEKNPRPLLQLARLNAFFGKAWMLAAERTANISTTPWVTTRKSDGQPRTLGARFFAVARNRALKSRRQEELSRRGYLWIFEPAHWQRPQPSMLFIPAPSRVQLPEIAEARRKKCRRMARKYAALGKPLPKRYVLPEKPKPVRAPREPKKGKKGGKGKSPYAKGKKVAVEVEVTVVRRKPAG